MPKNERNIRVVNITLYNFIGRIGFFIFLFFAGLYSSRVLSASDFGKAQYFIWMVNFTWLVLSFGGTSSIVRHLSSAFRKNQVQVIRQMIRFALLMTLISTIAAITTWILYSRYNQYYFSTFAYTLLITQFAVNYLQTLMASLYRYRSLFFINTFVSVSGIVLLLLLLPEYKLEAYLGVLTIVNMLLLAGYVFEILRIYFRIKHNKDTVSEPVTEDIPPFRQLLKTSAYFGLSAILAAILWQRTELYFIRLQLDFSSIAVYGVALSLIALFAEPFRIIPGGLLTYFAGIHEDKELINVQFSRFFSHFVWAVVFVLLFVWFNADQLVSAVYTDRYYQSAALIKILLIGFIPGICSYVMMNMHTGLSKARFLLWQDLLSASVFLVLIYFLISADGLIGVAWAKALAMCFSVAAGVWYTRFKLHISFPVKNILLSFILAILVHWLTGFISVGGLQGLAIKMVLAFVCYFSISYWLKILARDIINNIVEEGLKILKIKSRI